ncbi:MAG: glycosyltransferase family 4 protein [Chitinispirillaceae bacterium]|jgi:glycosyltransferase involved in cell wall biosynthesis|nr:glycosyltransferase family 4 protein [Chitinispirillaceae bacterium]
MRIGFDAKRIFFNASGLGNYGRTTVRILRSWYPNEQYWLYTHGVRNALSASREIALGANVKIATPATLIDRLLPDYWRAFSLTNQIRNDGIDLYHGLNNELPAGLDKVSVKKIMTVHDLIFIRFPQYYKAADRVVYKLKSKYSVGIADRIMADTIQTKSDLVDFFHVAPDKIEVVPLSCSPIFYKKLGVKQIADSKQKYNLPSEYILSVGTIEPRKNLLSTVKALHHGRIDMPLVAVGRPTPYLAEIMAYVSKHHLEKQVLFRHDVETTDLPALYQGAQLLAYVSMFEGFGFPVLEALYSGTPVITSKGGCFGEVGGPSSLYVDALDTAQISDAIQRVLGDSALREKMIADGYDYAQNFNEDKIAEKIMAVYRSVF